MEWFEALDQNWVEHDETANCSAFMCYCAKATSYQYPKDKKKQLLARSWLDIGIPIMNPLCLQCIVIFYRGNPEGIFGHVGGFVRKKDGYIWTLGANQDDEVNISPYPEKRVLGYRRLIKEGQVIK